MKRNLNFYTLFFPVLFLLAFIFILWSLIIPLIKNNISYKLPENLSIEETVEYYFDALDSGLPNKAANVLADNHETFDAFDLNEFSNIEAEDIKIINQKESYAEAQANITFDERFFCDTPMWSGQTVILLQKDNDSWKIKEMYPNI